MKKEILEKIKEEPLFIEYANDTMVVEHIPKNIEENKKITRILFQ